MNLPAGTQERETRPAGSKSTPFSFLALCSCPQSMPRIKWALWLSGVKQGK